MTNQASMLKDLGERLAQTRQARGINQREMAKLLGVTQSMVSDYENGTLRLHGELIIKLCEVLKVSSDEILGIQKEKASNDPVLQNRRLYKRFKQFDSLSKRDQDTVLRTMDAFLAKGN